MRALALIADIVKSKEIADRSAFQLEFGSFLSEISKNPAVVSPYTITLGDEFQALYAKPASLLNDCFAILVSFYPVKIRFSFGLGDINTEINRQSALGMDGSAFHSARDGLLLLKKCEHSIVQFYGGTAGEYDLLNASIMATMATMDSWKHNTFKTFHELRRQQGVSHIAKLLAISPKAVYKAIETHRLREYLALYEQLDLSLAEIYK